MGKNSRLFGWVGGQFGGRLGCVWGMLGELLGVICELPGVIWELLGVIWELLGVIWELLGVIWELPGISLDFVHKRLEGNNTNLAFYHHKSKEKGGRARTRPGWNPRVWSGSRHIGGDSRWTGAMSSYHVLTSANPRQVAHRNLAVGGTGSTNMHARSTNMHAGSTNMHARSTNMHAGSTNVHARSTKMQAGSTN